MKVNPRLFKRNGFSLMELLIVIAVLGIVTAIAIPNVIGYISKGDKTAKDAELHNVITAVVAAKWESTTVPRIVSTYSDIVIVADPSKPINDPARYLSKTTVYKYTVLADGTVTQGSKG